MAKKTEAEKLRDARKNVRKLKQELEDARKTISTRELELRAQGERIVRFGDIIDKLESEKRDFENALEAIQGRATYLKERLDETIERRDKQTDRVVELLSHVHELGLKIEELERQLLTKSRKLIDVEGERVTEKVGREAVERFAFRALTKTL